MLMGPTYTVVYHDDGVVPPGTFLRSRLDSGSCRCHTESTLPLGYTYNSPEWDCPSMNCIKRVRDSRISLPRGKKENPSKVERHLL